MTHATPLARTDAPLWELQGLCKAFPGVRANDHVSLVLHAGEIHGLLGENGCGKSTLIKMLSGVTAPDAGRILHRGRPLRLTDPIGARAAGIATVFQEFSLVPQLTVAENIFLGRQPRRPRSFLIDWPALYADARRILEQFDIGVDPHALVADLSVAEQQLVEIAKALSQDAELLILDEPTTALGQHEIDVLHRLLRRMKQRGVAILYISHRLDEVVALVDAVTILKDGRVASRAGDTALAVDDIVTSMIGADVREHYPKEANAGADVVLEVRDIHAGTRVRGASFDVRRGEVLGLGGVIGAGRTEIARALAGADRIDGGQIRLNGKALALRHPGDALAAGIALVTENRKYDGLFANFSAGPNMTMARLDALARGPLLDHAKEARVAADYVRDLEIAPLALRKSVSLLSGGNQQKVMIARCLFSQAQIVILDEPTQGIDIGAKLAVYDLINALTRAGKSVVLISSDHAELIAMSDRIAIVQHGRVGAVRPAAEVGPGDLVSASGRTPARARSVSLSEEVFS